MRELQKIITLNKTQFKITDSFTNEMGVCIPCIYGKLSEVEVISPNGYRYPSNFWNKVLRSGIVQNVIANRDMLGMIEHPDDDSEYLKTPYEKASHIVLEATVDAQGNPWGKFGILNNQHGNTLKALLDVGHMPGVSTRGLGDTAKDDKSVYIPDENYALITWDIVRNPNFASLKMEKITDSVKTSPAFKELVEMYHLRDSYQEVPNLDSDMKLAISSMRNQLEFMIQTLNKLNLKY